MGELLGVDLSLSRGRGVSLLLRHWHSLRPAAKSLSGFCVRASSVEAPTSSYSSEERPPALRVPLVLGRAL